MQSSKTAEALQHKALRSTSLDTCTLSWPDSPMVTTRKDISAGHVTLMTPPAHSKMYQLIWRKSLQAAGVDVALVGVAAPLVRRVAKGSTRRQGSP
jgi:hypothetical protein